MKYIYEEGSLVEKLDEETNMDEALCQLIHIVTTLSYCIGQAPYKWNSETQQFTAANSFQWKLIQVLLPLHLIYIISGSLYSLFRESLSLVILQSIYTSCVMLHYMFNVTNIIFFQMLLTNVNKYLNFLKDIKG